MLFLLTPVLLLGHMSGLLPEPVKEGFLAAFVALACLFAARKYSQPVEADIGDKSVFQSALLRARGPAAMSTGTG